MIIISPYAKGMRNKKPHPKNYPWWPELVARIKTDLGETLIQVGVEGEEKLTEDFRKNLSMIELAKLVGECKTWVSVDSFFQHFCWDLQKPGIVIFSQSDPNIFGHPENVNLLKSRKYLREHQFWLWEQAEYQEDAFVSVDEVIRSLTEHFYKHGSSSAHETKSSAC